MFNWFRHLLGFQDQNQRAQQLLGGTRTEQFLRQRGSSVNAPAGIRLKALTSYRPPSQRENLQRDVQQISRPNAPPIHISIPHLVNYLSGVASQIPSATGRVIGNIGQPFTQTAHIAADLPKGLLAIATHNQQARINAAKDVQRNIQELGHLGQGVARALPELGASITNRTLTPQNAAGRFLFGSTPIQPIQKGVAQTYRKHGLPAAVGYAVGKPLADIGITAGLLRPAVRGSVAVAENPAVRAELAKQSPGFAKLPSKEVDKYARTFGISKSQAQKDLGSIKEGTASGQAKFGAGEAAKEHVATVGRLPAKFPLSNQKTNKLTQLFGSKGTIVRKQGPYGRIMDKLVNKQLNEEQALQADILRQTPTVWKLNKKEFKDFVDTVEAKQPAATSAKTDQAVREWKSVTPQIRERALRAGLSVGNVEDYFPREYNRKIFKNQSQYNRSLQHLLNTGQAANLEDAVQLLRSYQKQVGVNRFGHLERSRTLELPQEFQLRNKDVLARYVLGSSRRITQAENFGGAGGNLDKLIGQISKSGYDAETVQKAVDRFLHAPQDTNNFSRAVKAIRQAESVSRLGLAPLSHAGQTVSNTATEAGLTRTVSAWFKSILKPSDRQFALKTGVTSPEELNALRSQGGYEGSLGRVTAPGYNKVMGQNRVVAAIAGRDWAKHLAKTGNVSRLEKLGVTGPIGKTLTEEQQMQAARGLVRDTLFRSTPWDTPLWAETPTGKTIGQFRMAYAYKQPGFVYNHVIKEAGRGNIAPLLRFMTTGILTGYATAQAKQAITGRQESHGNTLIDALAGLGGIPAEILAQGRYLAGNPIRTIAGEVAPLAGEAVDLAQKIKQGGSALEANLLKRIPIIGGRIASAIVPSASPGAIAFAKNRSDALKGQPADVIAAEGFLHPRRGDRTLETPATAKDALYQSNPKLFAIDKKIYGSQAKHDPIYDLSATQRNAVFNLAKIRGTLPGSTSQFGKTDANYIKTIQDSKWYQGFQKQRTAYYSNLKRRGLLTGTSTPQLTQPSPAVTRVLNQIGKPNVNTAILLDQNPKAEAYLAKHTDELNQQRADLSLPPLPKFPAPPNASLRSKDLYYNGLPQGTGDRSAYLRNNPDYFRYWQQKQNYYNELGTTTGSSSTTSGGFRSSSSTSSSSTSASSTKKIHHVSLAPFTHNIPSIGIIKPPKVKALPKGTSLIKNAVLPLPKATRKTTVRISFGSNRPTYGQPRRKTLKV